MIQIKDNELSHQLLKSCKSWLEKANWSYGWPSNDKYPFGHWNVDISRTGASNPTDIADRLPEAFKSLWNEINSKFFNDKAVLIRCYSNRHTFGTEGYIHTDTDRKEDQTIVIYMDENWNYEWGGETTFYKKGEIIKSVVPKYGRYVAFPGNIEHCAKPLSRVCPTVRTTLMFKASIDPKAVYPAEQLLSDFLTDIGANSIPHKKGSLKDHLIRVFHILKTTGANDILALAGGLHSVFGTSTFRKTILDKESTAVKDTFGPEIDRIVRLFSTINRPDVLENPDGSLNDVDLFLLRAIECANLYDQSELDAEKYPNLYEFVKIFKKG